MMLMELYWLCANCYIQTCSGSCQVLLLPLSRNRPLMAARRRAQDESHLRTRPRKGTGGMTQGGFGRCYEVVSRECGRRFACKAIDKQSTQFGMTKEKVRSEVGLHRRMAHPHIVRFESTHEDERFIYILLELCTNNVPLPPFRPSMTSCTDASNSRKWKLGTICGRFSKESATYTSSAWCTATSSSKTSSSLTRWR
jgi:hypothetical protein